MDFSKNSINRNKTVSTAEMNTQTELKNDKVLLERSSFNWHGKSLPYMKYVPSDSEEWLQKYKRDSLKHREPYAKDILKNSCLANNNPEAITDNRKELQFDILSCPYCSTLKTLNCPELCPVICKQDEYFYKGMKNCIFERTKTLGNHNDKRYVQSNS